MNRLIALILASTFLALAALAQAQGVIITVAGGGPNNMPALSANLSFPTGMAIDSNGNQYIADGGQNRIFRVDKTGRLTVFAGNGTPAFGGDGGVATAAALNNPVAIALDSSGNLYIADNYNSRVRRVDAATGKITTVAGNGIYGFSGDGGLATSASLRGPNGLAVDTGGNLYISDGNRIRRVDSSSGIITTVAGNGTYGFSGDGGLATSASLRGPNGLAVDTGGNLYIADTFNNRIRRINSETGIITSVAGNGTFGFSGDGGPATTASLRYPFDIALDGGGSLYIADTSNSRIRRVELSSGTITTVVGNGTSGPSGDGGPATAAGIAPHSLALDSVGNLYISDYVNSRIRRVDAMTAIITTVAGNGERGFSGDGGPAINASLWSPYAAAVDIHGNLYIADTANERIRRVDAATGVISTVAGGGANGVLGDGGPATAAYIGVPQGVAVDSGGNIYIAEDGVWRIRRVDATTGIITTVAGNGTYDVSGDGGPATAAGLGGEINGVALDRVGNIYIATSRGGIRRVDASTGIITTAAGGGTPGALGDGGPATEATLRFPVAMAFDGDGNLYIADMDDQRIRRVDAVTGIITTVAGNGIWSFSGDGGPATAASLRFPRGVALDSGGNLYISDSGNSRIRQVNAATGVITTVVGNGTFGFSGDGGLALVASLASPGAISLDGGDQLYIPDIANERVRLVLTPVGAIHRLSLEIANSSLPMAIRNSMTTRLGVAAAKLGDSNPNNNAAACGIVNSTANQITAMQNSGKLSVTDAATLKQSVDAAVLAIGCR